MNHFLGFSVMLTMWAALGYALRRNIEEIDFTQIPTPGREWKAQLGFLSIIGIAWIMLVWK